MNTIPKLLTVAIIIAAFSFIAHAEQTTYVLDFTSDGNTTITNITETEASTPISTPTTSTKESSYSSPVEVPSQDTSLNQTIESNTSFQSTDDSQVDPQDAKNTTIPAEQKSTPTILLASSTLLILLLVVFFMRKKA